MKKLLFLFLVVVLLFTVGWTLHHKDGHTVHNYDLTFDILAFSGGAAEVIPVECEKIIIKASGANSAVYAYIGESTVTATDNNFQLAAGAQVTIDSYITATTLYVIGDGSGQIYYICFN